MTFHRFVLITALVAAPSLAFAQKIENSFSGDPSIAVQYVPGKYYEQRALEQVQKKHFRQALELYQKAGYWGNKIAQYDVGMLYLNGADGVPKDKIKGIAWLGIAAQRHAPYVDQALADVYTTASPQEKKDAGDLFKTLMVDYGDKVTLDRATKRFQAQYLRDKGQIIGSGDDVQIVYGNFGGGGGDELAQGPTISRLETIGEHPDSHVLSASRFLASVKDQFSDYVQTQFGVVTVGEPETIGEREQRAQATQPPPQH